jgi:hypothetical protein
MNSDMEATLRAILGSEMAQIIIDYPSDRGL